jgi:serine/threonine-protein kinase RIO1
MNLPEGVRVPKMVMLPNGVLAVEYIDGSHPDTHCWFADHDCDDASNCWYTKLMATGVSNIRGFGDISFLNVIMTDNAIYVIDLEI